MSKWKAANPVESGFMYFTIKSCTRYLCAYLLGKAQRVFWHAWGYSICTTLFEASPRSTNLRSWGNLMEICWQSFRGFWRQSKKKKSGVGMGEICSLNWEKFVSRRRKCCVTCFVTGLYVCNNLAFARYLGNTDRSPAQYSIDREGIIAYDKKYERIWCRSFSCPRNLLWRWVDTL